VEPSDESLRRHRVRQERSFDAFVAVGGGSVIDGEGGQSLHHGPRDFLIVNRRRQRPRCRSVKAAAGDPDDGGTGQTTAVMSTKARRRRRHRQRRLKPTLGYLDPDNTRTMPPKVAASPGSTS
jgi:hydroxyacid-oxoacid transhydrogenase